MLRRSPPRSCIRTSFPFEGITHVRYNQPLLLAIRVASTGFASPILLVAHRGSCGPYRRKILTWFRRETSQTSPFRYASPETHCTSDQRASRGDQRRWHSCQRHGVEGKKQHRIILDEDARTHLHPGIGQTCLKPSWTGLSVVWSPALGLSFGLGHIRSRFRLAVPPRSWAVIHVAGGV